METTVSIWDRADLADPLDAMIKTEHEGRKDWDLVMAQIPSLFGESDKATYLGYRALGIRAGQAIQLMGLHEDTLKLWREETPELEQFEYEKLPELQSKINADIIRLQFTRNMVLFQFQDSRIISKSLNEFETLTAREYNYLRSIRRFYSNQDYLTMLKALEPEKHRQNVVVLSFGNQGFEVEEGEDGNTLKEVEYVNRDPD